ncbi:MAG: FtsX-like permease family protein [Thermoleophilia bacterium]|nr:FtsX-like permease family protein [Thermoleophilia bacterium]
MLLLKTWRDIKARKGQFSALIILVALGITSFVAFVSGYYNLTASADQANSELKLADFTVHVVDAPRSAVDGLKNIPGVAAVQGRLVIDTGVDLDENTQLTGRVISVPAGTHPPVDDILIESGSYPAEDSPGIFVNKKFASDNGIGPGDRLGVWAGGVKYDIEISGTVTSPEYIYPIRAKGELPSPKEFAVIFMTEDAAGQMFGLPSSYNDFAVSVAPGADREAVIGEVESVLEPYRVEETVRQEDQPSNFALHEEIRQNQSFAYFMPLVILIISALSLFIALSRLVQSQRGEIGLAKALGYANWQILLHYLFFSLIIAAAGAIVGFALGQIFAIFITNLYTDLLGIPFLESQIHIEVILWSVLMSTVSCVAAGLLPAYASARLLPVKAMHADPTLVVSGGKIPLVEKLLRPILPKAFTFRIPLRNVFRAKRRSLYTIIGIAFALVLTISTWAMFDTFNELIDVHFVQTENWDVTAAFEVPFTAGMIEDVRGIEGVNNVQTALQLPARLEAGGRTHESNITAMEPDQSFHYLNISEGASTNEALAGAGLIMTPAIAKKLGAKVGDEITVSSPYVKEEKLTLMSLSDEAWGAPVYVSAAEGRKLSGSPGGIYNTLYLDVDPDQAQAIKKQLYSLPGAATIMIKTTLIDSIRSMFDLLYTFGAILLLFGFTMAFVVIYNTFTANILERSREIATMRTIGEDRLHLAAMVTLENMFLAIVGIPVGIVMGLWVANALYKSLSTEAYSLKVVIYGSSYAMIILSILVVLLISEIPPIWRIFKLDLAEATKVIE